MGRERDRHGGAESIMLKGNDKMDMRGAGCCFGNPISHHEFLKEWGWVEREKAGWWCGRGWKARQIWMEDIYMLPTHCTAYMLVWTPLNCFTLVHLCISQTNSVGYCGIYVCLLYAAKWSMLLKFHAVHNNHDECKPCTVCFQQLTGASGGRCENMWALHANNKTVAGTVGQG